MRFFRNESSPIGRNYGDTQFITGMRAFAAFAVVLIHSGGAGFRDLGFVGGNIADFGRAGVYVFFVISGFSVASSYKSSGGYFDYINKRLWRIAPLYYFWLAASIILGVTATYWQKQLNADIDFYNILLHVFFIGFLDYRITNSIIGVEWSISIEVFWYFVVPLLLFVSDNKVKTLLLLIISFIFYVLSTSLSVTFLANGSNAMLAMQWSPIPYFFSYALGIVAYRFRHVCKHSNVVGSGVLALVITLFGVYVSNPLIILKVFYDEFVFVSLASAALILFGTGKSTLFGLIFNNPASQFLGLISYGIYLSHLPLLVLLTRFHESLLGNLTLLFFLVSIFSVFVSFVTYYLFEKSFINIGKNFGKQAFASRART